MPFFDFECKHCGYVFDKLISAREDETAECPICGSEDTTKLVSLFASFGTSTSGSGGCTSFG